MTRYRQPLIQYIVPDTGNAPVQVYGEQSGGTANTTSQASVLFDGLWWHEARRNGNAAAARVERPFGGGPNFHALVDPTGPAIPLSYIFEDYVSGLISVGACEGAVGFLEHITVAVANTLVGVGFRFGPDHIWHAFVNDCPNNSLPVTVRRDTAFATKLATNSHRLKIVIDGLLKAIIWYIDGVEVDRWVPGAALDQMGAVPGPRLNYTMIVPANGDARIRMHAGGNPQLSVLW